MAGKPWERLGVDRWLWHSCLRKRPFPTKCAALTTGPGRAAYLCKHCGQWHLTHKREGKS